MSIEVLNVEKTKKLIEARGLKMGWVIKQIGVTRTVGFQLLREGWLPKDNTRKVKVLRELSKLLGVEAEELLLTLVAKRTAS